MGRKSRLKKERKQQWVSEIPYQQTYEYSCECCGAKDNVPAEAINAIANMFDRDITTLPSFFCDECGKGRSVPVNYPCSHDEHILGEKKTNLKYLGEVVDNITVVNELIHSHQTATPSCPCCQKPMEYQGSIWFDDEDDMTTA